MCHQRVVYYQVDCCVHVVNGKLCLWIKDVWIKVCLELSCLFVLL